jgi:hypothetical protein
VTTAELSAAGHGDDPAAAGRSAADAIVASAARSLGETAARRWPDARPAEAGGVVVAVRGAGNWRSIEALQAALTLPGARTSIRRIGGGLVDIAVDGASIDRASAAIRTAALPLGTATIDRTAGDKIEVTIDGDREGDD